MPPALNTWTDMGGVTHGIDEYDTGYIDPVYDWVPWCKAVEVVPARLVEKNSKRPINCIACMKEMP